MNDVRLSLIDDLRQNAALALLALAHVPFLAVYFTGLWRLEHYQFFPFALIAFVGIYIARSNRERIRLGRAGRYAIAIDILMLVASSATNWPKLTAIGFVFFCFAIAHSTWEWEVRRRLTSLALIPLILISPPQGLDVHAIFWLQQKTTWLASRVLERLGHLHLRRGNMIELPDKPLLVEEACSGVQSLFTVLFLTILIICWQRRGIVHILLLLPAGVLFAGTMNIFRVVAIGVAWQNWQLDLTEGWQHDTLGYTALLGAILLLVSTDSMLHFFLAPFQDHIYGPFIGLYRNPFTLVWNFVCGGLIVSNSRTTIAEPELNQSHLAGASIVTLLAVGLQGMAMFAGVNGHVYAAESDLSFFDETVLPTQLDDFMVMDYSTETRNRNSSQGEYSNTWQLKGHGLNTVVSCDHAFVDWHYLNLCYTGNGWTVSNARELHDDPDWGSIIFDLTNEQLGRHGCVIYSHFSADGSPKQPSNPEMSVEYALNRLHHHVSNSPWGLLSEPINRTSYQVQAFVESGSAVTDEQLAAVRKLHLDTRARLRQHYVTTHEAGAASTTELAN